MSETTTWLRSLAEDWRGEIPLRIHARVHGTAYGLGAAPPFSPEFINYLGHLECGVPDCVECREHRRHDADRRPRAYQNQNRTRTSRAFRKLRRFAPREFDTLYMYCVLGYPLAEIASRLSLENHARGLDPITTGGVSVLLASGVDKVRQLWW